MTEPASPWATARWHALGTTALVAVVDGARLNEATATARCELEAFEATCSRFREDSEILTLGDRPRPVSRRLFTIVEVALAVARYTGGAVDPTVGASMQALGYDRDYEELGRVTGRPEATPVPAPGWRSVVLDPVARTICTAPGTVLDLGASAKALAADQVARRIARELATGTLVDLGGDVAVAGPPPRGGWPIGVGPVSDGPAEQVVVISRGGVASSSPHVRTWEVGGRSFDHIVDPRTGRPAPRRWRSVSAYAPSAVEANALTTAAVVWGDGAVDEISARGGSARLVGVDGAVQHVGTWPEEHASRAA